MRLSSSTALPLSCYLALVALMALLSVHTLTSIYQDIGRHIRLGEIIWETKSVPGTNLFSYTHPDFPFINHHWLGELALYAADRAVGLKGIILLKALLLSGSFALALAAAWRNRSALAGTITGFLALLVMVERTDARPEVLSYLFIAWFLFVLYRKPATWLIWTLPLIQLFWVNTHIYFFMGPLIWLAFLVGKAVRGDWILDMRYWHSVGAKGAIKALISNIYFQVSAAMVIAALCNPSFLDGALYPLRVFGNYGYSVMENQTPFFLRAWGYPQVTSTALYLLILWVLAAALANRARWRGNLMGYLLCVVTAILALMMVRNFPLFALCAMPAAIRNWDEAGWHTRSSAVLGWTLALLLLFGATVATNQFYDQAQLGKRFGLIVPEGHQASVDFFRREGIRGPILNNFDIGSYLIWKLPEEPVFIDGRPEAYPASFIQDEYIGMQEDDAVFRERARHYGINAIFWNEADITPWSRAFMKRIVGDPAWRIVYRERGIVILVRETSEQ